MNKMNLAAFRAMVTGDVENFIAASTKGGIEAQEAQGQRDFVDSEILPKEILRSDGVGYEALGIKVIGDYDELFYNVQLPTGWTKRATDHSMHSELLDDKGRKRAGIFYKAAFYDRKAHISFDTRYVATSRPICGYDVPYEVYKDAPTVGVIKDSGVEIWVSESIENTRENYSKDTDIARAKLTEMYPDWRNVLAYWD